MAAAITPMTSGSASASTTSPSCARSGLRPIASSSRSNARATTAPSARTSSRPSTGRSPPAGSEPRGCVLPTCASMRCCRLSSCSGSLPKAFGRPTCAGVWRPCRGTIRPRSHRAPLPINCAGCGSMALSSASPKASATASPTSAYASLCSSPEPTTACSVLLLPPRSRYWTPSPRLFNARLTPSRSRSTQQSGKPRWPHKT